MHAIPFFTIETKAIKFNVNTYIQNTFHHFEN